MLTVVRFFVPSLLFHTRSYTYPTVFYGKGFFFFLKALKDLYFVLMSLLLSFIFGVALENCINLLGVSGDGSEEMVGMESIFLG